MPNKFKQDPFTGRQELDAIAISPVGASLAIVASYDVTSIASLTVSAAVSGAALTGFAVWARGSSQSEWIPIAAIPTDFTDVTGLALSARSDGGADLTTTPAGVTATFGIDTTYWSDVAVLAKSAGAAVLSITAGGRP